MRKTDRSSAAQRPSPFCVFQEICAQFLLQRDRCLHLWVSAPSSALAFNTTVCTIFSPDNVLMAVSACTFQLNVSVRPGVFSLIGLPTLLSRHLDHVGSTWSLAVSVFVP